MMTVTMMMTRRAIMRLSEKVKVVSRGRSVGIHGCAGHSVAGTGPRALNWRTFDEGYV